MLGKMIVAAAAVFTFMTAWAIPATGAPGPRIVRILELSPTRSSIFVASPAMGRVVQVQLLHPADRAPHPTFYLLDGVDSDQMEDGWTRHTDAAGFFAGKPVNVVLPMGGRGSYYTDWERRDPVLGRIRWETFLTSELPPLLDGVLHTNGRTAIGGLSMGGTAAMILAVRHPALYRAVAVYSGCPNTTSPNARMVIRQAVVSQGGSPAAMWGAAGDPEWSRHDPTTLAEELRGKALYLSVGGGIPGSRDLFGPTLAVVPAAMLLESAAQRCVQMFDLRLRSLSIPATVVYHATGTHTWPYWQDDLHDSWPMLAAALAR